MGLDSLLVDGDVKAFHAMGCGRCRSLLHRTVHHHDRMRLRVPYGPLSEAPKLKPMAHVRRLEG
jgi:hypothetical protein